MSFLKVSLLVHISMLLHPVRSSPALPAVQNINLRDQYQGGWPLALQGTNSGSCPAEASVQCASTEVNPECCPSGQTCFFGSDVFSNYCCPTSADCNTAVLNFPRCANTSWNMFEDIGNGFFCCEPGTLGVYPSVGKSGGICEPSDQAIPTSLLATLVSQVGAQTSNPTPTSTPTATGGAGNATGPAETNPSLLPSSTSNSDGGGDGSTSRATGPTGISGWSTAVKIGVVIGVAVALLAIVVIVVLCNRRRRRSIASISSNAYAYNGGEYTTTGELDEYGNRVPPAYTAEYELRGKMAMDVPAAAENNNMTVNVVRGDMHL